MQPRNDQLDVLQRIEEALDAGVDSILLVAPTGWGKTLVLCLVLQLIARRLGQQGLRILGVAHRDRLLLQWLDALYAVAPDLLPQVTLLNTASPRVPRADILAIDEAHHAAARSYHALRQRVAPRLVIAVTATPERHDRLGLEFARTIYAPSINDLITAGVLSPYNHFALDTAPEPEELVTAVIAEPDRWGQTLLFLPTVLEVEASVVRMRRAGIPAAPALGDRSRETATAAFAAGSVQVLATCHALTEGVDVPSVQTVVLRDALPGQVQQAVGRALRRQGDKVANVVQFASAPTPYITIARPRQRWVGSAAAGWRALPVDPTWPTLALQAQTALADQSFTPATVSDDTVAISSMTPEDSP